MMSTLMKIVDYGPQSWFLLKSEANYYLSVRCQQSFAEYELLIQLNPDEWREYHALGHVYIDYLAARVSYWAREYHNRDLSKQLSSQVSQAFEEWKANQVAEAV
ncbi:hypothetical protein IAD21_04356 [Abditibacteriota bacterium]|nr:hypothetical protein IAD21_04356 [Abditibacteriota bacterium]